MTVQGTQPAPPLTPRQEYQRQIDEALERAREQLEAFEARPEVRALLRRELPASGDIVPLVPH